MLSLTLGIVQCGVIHVILRRGSALLISAQFLLLIQRRYLVSMQLICNHTLGKIRVFIHIREGFYTIVCTLMKCIQWSTPHWRGGWSWAKARLVKTNPSHGAGELFLVHISRCFRGVQIHSRSRQTKRIGQGNKYRDRLASLTRTE